MAPDEPLRPKPLNQMKDPPQPPLSISPGRPSPAQDSSQPRLLGCPPAIIRIVVPAHQEEQAILCECLTAVRNSSIGHDLEIMIADDTEGSHWRSFALSAGLRWTSSGACGSAAIARNAGTSGFEGDVLVFIDADVKVEPRAIELLVEPILTGLAEATVGNYTERIRGMNFASTYKHLYVATVYGRCNDYLRNEYWTGLGAVRRDVFQQLHGFGVGFRGATGEDTEFGCRLTAAGHRVMAVNAARATHLKRFTLPALVKNDLRKGARSAGLLLKHRVAFTDFRHSSRRDCIAVILAASLVGALLLLTSGFQTELTLACLGGIIPGYLLLRRDLARTFYRHSPLFMLPAVLLMWVLDLVRGFCVARALGSIAVGPLLEALRSAHLLKVSPQSAKHRTV